MRKNDVKALCTIAALYLGLGLLGITCPIKFLTGISCAGCGMTRAWLCLLRGDIGAAFSYHPLFLLPIPGAAVLLLRRRLPRKLFTGLLAAMLAILLLVYAARMLDLTDSVVVFDPDQGLIPRLLSEIW